MGLTEPLTLAHPLPGFALRRPQLLRRLDEGTQGKLTCLTAPAGYGKTFLLTQWAAEHRGAPVAWLSLEDTDDNAISLARRLVSTLEAVDSDIGRSALERLEQSGAALGENFVRQLIDELASVGEAILVVDDLGALRNAAVLEELGALVEGAPRTFHVVVSGRSSAYLPAENLRPDEDITSIDAADLAFDLIEAKALLREVSGRSLTELQAMALVDRTEGWPAGLQLAAIALRDEPDVDAFIQRFAGDDQDVASYILQEVVSGQPAPVRRFLLDTSVLRQLSGSLCDAVTGGEGAGEMLERLEREGLLIQRSSRAVGWFRYHGLFRDLLRHELRSAEPGAEARTLRRAADWHLAHDDPENAAPYLIESEDWDRVLDLVDRHGRPMYEATRPDVVLSWLEAVPVGVRSRHVGLQRALLHAMVGNSEIANQVVRELRTQPMSPGERAVADMVQAAGVLWHTPPPVVIEAADAVLEGLPALAPDAIPDILGITEPHNLQTVAAASRARAKWHMGNVEEARSALIELAAQNDAYLPFLVHILGALALLESWAGRLTLAEEHASRAMACASEAGLESAHPSTADACLAKGVVLRERNHLGRAELAFDEARVRAGRNRAAVPLAMLAGERAVLLLARGQPGRGLQEIGAYRAAGAPTPGSAVTARLRATEARLLLALGEPHRADDVLRANAGAWDPELSAAATQAAVFRGDVHAAREALASWPSEGEHRSQLERELWAAIVDSLEGHRRKALERMAEVVVRAEPDGHVRLFLDAGNDALRLLRALFQKEPTTYLRLLLEPTEPSGDSGRGTGELAEPLSEREMQVVRFLPTRLSAAEIAAELYVSLNTLKTHLRNIYRKLGVSGRREAIEAAERLGLA